MKFRVTVLLLCMLLTFIPCHAEELVLGSRGEEVIEVQERLIELGYLSGAADGQYGEQTSIAITLFQRTNGLGETGTVNPATYRKLFSDDVVQDDTMLAQQRLIELGFLEGYADGIWGERSAAALMLFQAANDLAQTGELDAATQSALFSEAARRNDLLDAERMLISLGYLAGTADGVADSDTSAALTRFQQLHGLTASGEADEATLTTLSAAGDAYAKLQYGSSGDAVSALQQRLIDLGFLNDSADGNFGKNTAAAVSSFQEHLTAQGNITAADGIATPLVQEYLYSTNYSTYVQTLQTGDEGSEVLRLENRLVSLGYMDVTADTVFDAYTAQAISAFQLREALTESSTADKPTIDKLFSGDAQIADTYVEHTISLGDSGKAVQAAQEILLRYGMYTGFADGKYSEQFAAAVERFHGYLIAVGSEHADDFSTSDSLSIAAQQLLKSAELCSVTGSIDSASDDARIRQLQRRLVSLFYLAETDVDGGYGDKTKSAVSAFQEKNGLNATGIADEDTQNILFSDNAIGNWTPYLLEISIDEQQVHVHQLNESNEYEQIDSFICSTGLGDTTPTGIFVSTQPLNRWHYFKKFKCWAQYSYQIEGDILFHSVLYDEKDVDTLRMNSVYALGYKASHGCIRLQVEDAQWVYENCRRGTIVVIH